MSYTSWDASEITITVAFSWDLIIDVCGTQFARETRELWDAFDTWEGEGGTVLHSAMEPVTP